MRSSDSSTVRTASFWPFVSRVREEFRRHYVAHKTQTNFVDVVPQKCRLPLTLNMRFDELSDPRGLAADITNLGRWGNGDVQVELDNERQIT